VTSSPGSFTGTGTTSPINVSGLNNGIAYTFAVVATNAAGSSVASTASVAVTPATVPDAPTSVVATAGNLQASVAFIAPVNTGGSPITGYTVTSSPGSFTGTGTTSPINVSGLTNGTAYTFAVVATNAVGPSIASVMSGSVVPSNACFGISSIVDIENNTYNTVTIGAQCWTKENLKVKKYNDNTAIPVDNSGGTNGMLSQTWSSRTTGYYTIYANQATNVSNYGLLYNWFAVANVKKLCPAGWHVPSDTEWKTLQIQLGGSALAGGKMKSTSLWTAPNTGADNSSGFTALPGGYRYEYGEFYGINVAANFWSATSRNTLNAYYYQLANGNANLYQNGDWEKTRGNSVRCLKD
jgi:uncharacterized protein (TIGR02145 family)